MKKVMRGPVKRVVNRPRRDAKRKLRESSGGQLEIAASSKVVRVACRGADTTNLADLHPFQGDLKHLSEENYEKLRAAILKYGFSFPFAVWQDGDVLRIEDGHQRAKVLKRMAGDGYEIPPLPIDYIEAADEREAKEKILLATSQYGEMDGESLNNFLMESGLEFPELKNLLALPEIDLERFSDKYFPPETPEAPEPQIDKAAELQKKWKTKVGQIWEIGKHKLMCGDSLESWDRLLTGINIDFVLTDPPYGVGVEYGESCKDDYLTVEMIVSKVLPRLRKFPVCLIACGQTWLWNYPKANWVLAWIHPAGMSICPWGFCGLNPILAYGADPYLKAGKGSRPDTLILAADREGVEGHPTPKPIKVWSWFLERASPFIGQTVYDPFLGSGTTMVAAETLGRICYGVEIDPGYCAVTLQRMADMGLEPQLVNPPKSQIAIRRKALKCADPLGPA